MLNQTNPTTVINIKIPVALKQQAQSLAASLGFPLSTVINAQLRQFVMKRKLEFEVPYEMTPYLEKIVAKARKDWKAGKNISPAFDNVGDAMKWLQKNK